MQETAAPTATESRENTLSSAAQTPLIGPQEVPLRALMGIGAYAGEEWNYIRALQIEPLRGRLREPALMNGVVAIITATVYMHVAPLWLIGAWLLTFLLFQAVALGHARTAELWDRKTVAAEELHWLHLSFIGDAVLWLAAFFLIAPHGAQAQLLALCALTLVLAVHVATSMTAVPLGSSLFTAIISGGATLAFLRAGEPIIGLACGIIGVLLIAASNRLAMTYIRFRLAEAAMQEKSETVSLLLREHEDSGADWLWQTDIARRATQISPRFAYALGQDADKIEGEPFLKLVAGEAWDTRSYPAALHDLAEKLKRREAFSNLVVPVRIKGEQRWWELSASPRVSDEGSFLGFRGVGSDITEQRESQIKIGQLARFDTLTGLPNRLQLTEALAAAMREAEKWNSRCGFMMIDLDRFKAINDTLGHPLGDRLLSQVARRLHSIMTDNELCGRLGGDEFAIVLRDASDSQHVAQIAQKVIQIISRPYEVDQHTLYIGASVGSAVGPRDGRTVDALMRSADLALYRSKDEGGGVHNVYLPQLHAHAEERRVMEIELRHALERDELSLTYQPVVAARDHNVVGFEALLRWNNARFGPVSPAKFVPVAEDARLIVPIGAWVVKRACKDAMGWPSSAKVAVNVSADQLSQGGFAETVAQALQESGLPPWRLELEVTESVFLRDGGQASQALDRLLGMGLQLSLDDFGTGYSALGYLRKTRFNTIKVDRSFVQGAARNVPESLAIIRAVVAMADSLGMATTAEGVETEAELEMIEMLGCKKIQGYYFGRPMSYADTIQLFRRRAEDMLKPAATTPRPARDAA